MRLSIRNVTQDASLGDSIETAESSAARRTGLLKHARLAAGAGLWIVPCEAIHTFFMQFSIDVLYIDKKRRVRKAVRDLRPWRLSMCLAAHSVIELPAGVIEHTHTQVGDDLEILSSV